MTAGIPGTGIGGVFYLVSALVMPLVEIFRTVRGRSSVARWMLVIRQQVMALSILGGMWLLGLGLGLLIHERPTLEFVREMHGQVSAHVEHLTQVNVFHVAPILMSTATLLFILSFTQLLRLIFRPVSRG